MKLDKKKFIITKNKDVLLVLLRYSDIHDFF